MTANNDNPTVTEVLKTLTEGDYVELTLRLRFNGTRNDCQFGAFFDDDDDEIVVNARDLVSIRTGGFGAARSGHGPGRRTGRAGSARCRIRSRRGGRLGLAPPLAEKLRSSSEHGAFTV